MVNLLDPTFDIRMAAKIPKNKKTGPIVQPIRNTPFLILEILITDTLLYHEGYRHASGRSSDSWFVLLAAPSHPHTYGQWQLQRSSPITAAGPFRISTGFPIVLYPAPEVTKPLVVLVKIVNRLFPRITHPYMPPIPSFCLNQGCLKTIQTDCFTTITYLPDQCRILKDTGWIQNSHQR